MSDGTTDEYRRHVDVKGQPRDFHSTEPIRNEVRIFYNNTKGCCLSRALVELDSSTFDRIVKSIPEPLNGVRDLHLGILCKSVHNRHRTSSSRENVIDRSIAMDQDRGMLQEPRILSQRPLIFACTAAGSLFRFPGIPFHHQSHSHT